MKRSTLPNGVCISLAFSVIVLPKVLTQGSTCANKQKICPLYKNVCDANGFKYWMQLNCMKTCGHCKVSDGDKKPNKPKDPVKWTKCTKTCGTGSRYRKICVRGSCKREYQACSTWSCPKARCPAKKYWRYGIEHSCCRRDKAPCGRPTVGSSTRVVGGKNANSAKAWPWMVVVYAPGYNFCGGVILHKKFVVSAAHCFFDKYGRRITTSSFKIYTKVLKLSKGNPENASSIKKLTLHPKYRFPANDLAIIELSTSLKYGDELLPICLPGGEETPKDTTCYVTGWGVSINPGYATDHLQEAGLQIFDSKVCKTAFAKYDSMKQVIPFLNRGRNYICAGSLHKITNTCKGDSGGALVCQRCSSCTWYLAGIVAFGLPDCTVKAVPGVYMKIKSFENWILSKTDVRKSSKKVCKRKIGP